MAKFKVGDVITPTSYEHTADVTMGNLYTVTGCDGTSVKFKDDVGYPRTRDAANYKLAACKGFTIGDSVKAVSSGEGYTKGKAYTISDVSSEWIYINGDKVESEDGKNPNNFVKIEPEQPVEAAHGLLKDVVYVSATITVGGVTSTAQGNLTEEDLLVIQKILRKAV
jgi:hypothetical protein